MEQPGLEQWRWAITPLRVRHSVPVSPASARHTPTLRGCFLRAAMFRVVTATVAVHAAPLFSRELRHGGPRREDFDLMVGELVTELIRRWPQVATIDVCGRRMFPRRILLPGSLTTSSWRAFPGGWRRGLHDRIVVYRLPITLRCAQEEVAVMTRRVLIDAHQSYPGAAAGRNRRRDALSAASVGGADGTADGTDAFRAHVPRRGHTTHGRVR